VERAQPKSKWKIFIVKTRSQEIKEFEGGWELHTCTHIPHIHHIPYTSSTPSYTLYTPYTPYTLNMPHTPHTTNSQHRNTPYTYCTPPLHTHHRHIRYAEEQIVVVVICLNN
jgi:hypothetical protein